MQVQARLPVPFRRACTLWYWLRQFRNFNERSSLTQFIQSQIPLVTLQHTNPNKMKTILLSTLLFISTLAFAQTGTNSVGGNITLASSTEAFLKKGTSYKGNVPMTAEKKRVDARNNPKDNIYISLHPLDFKCDLVKQDAKITQRAKTFLPNVVAITRGSKVLFMNEDEHYHNIHSLTSKARFNIGRRPPGNVYGQKINKLGVVRLGCDIHDEMAAWVLSLDTNYFTKIESDGSYKITDIPDGEYELRVYHPMLEKYATNVNVQGGKVTKNISLNPKP